MFTVIPVIDLLDGQVVHARRGDRANYRPIESPLCTDSSPVTVVAGLLSVYRFPVIYIADLGAILNQGHHRSQVQTLMEQFEDVTWWVDAGFSAQASLQSWRHPAIKPVVGTESITEPALLNAANHPLVLSLDRKSDDIFDRLNISQQPHTWPDDVIVMTLDKVGSGDGPAIDHLSRTQDKHPHGRIFAAGGVRHAEDLQQLKNAGIAGALIATALHNGSLTGAEIAGLMQ